MTQTDQINQIIIHVDMDAFYASVEMRDDPSLRGKPLIIGALPSERGVVATANYEARKYGVHSGMNIKEAYYLCPNGIYKHPDFDKYRQVSARLHEIWNTYASAAEYIALDEAYLDVTEQAAGFDGARGAGRNSDSDERPGFERDSAFDGARRIAEWIKQQTREQLRLSCSVGVGYSKTAAKTASEEKKPNGYFEIRTPEDFVNLIIDRDVKVLYTVGAKTAEKLNRMGIYKVRDIRDRKDEVIRQLGRQGRWITQLAFGEDSRKVTPYRPEDAKSVSREITFQEDVNDYGFLEDVLLLLAICVQHRAERTGLHGGGVTLKLTYADMRNITRSKLVQDADEAAVIWEESVGLLHQVERRPVRLIGAGIYHMSGEEERQLSFEDLTGEMQSERERIIAQGLDWLQEKYGLDFAANIDKLFQNDVLHRTVEYMRKHSFVERGNEG